ncbi:restriction endonuclease subunit S [Atopobium fossor]|uniref:restriction endonuclease subunit S n=1 Tax=Atopobium fossor TaxID=39487 RepID=UPI00041CA51C|nr:restriction endonuclease subunit S [Atopobium fossor]
MAIPIKAANTFFSTAERIIPEGLKKSRFVEAGDFLLTNSMSFGRPYIMKTSGCIHDGWLVLRKPDLAFDVDFLYSLLSSSMMFDQFSKAAAGSAVKNLNIDKVKKALVPIPPLAEQRRIVESIDELMPLVEEYGRLEDAREALDAALPDRLRKSVLQMAVQSNLVEQDPADEPASVLLDLIREERAKLIKEKRIKVPKGGEPVIYRENGSWFEHSGRSIPVYIDDEIPFEIPEGWEWSRMDSLCRSIQYGHTSSASVNGSVKILHITDIQNGKVAWEAIPFCKDNPKDLESCALQIDDVLIARTGGTVGKSFVVKSLPEQPSVFASYLIRLSLVNTKLADYINRYLGSSWYWQQLVEAASGTGQPNVNSKALGKLLVPVPPHAEQHRIAERVEIFMTLIG